MSSDKIAEDISQKNANKEKSFLEKFGGLIFIAALIIFFIFIGISGINFGQWLANTALWYYYHYGDMGIYLGVFVISIFGNFTVIFPVPYTIAIIVISVVVPGVNPVLLGLVAGLGAGIGEVSAWLIGRGSQELLQDSEKMERMKGYVDRGWAPLLIFIFAATPLPDDAFLIVLGLAQYKLWKTLIWCFLGKFVLCFLCSAIPIWLMGTPIGDTFLDLYGIDLEAAKAGVIPASTVADIIRSTVMWVGTIVVIFLLVYVDWGKIFEKFKREKDEN
ncbi:MAG: VTT domain-containing protein [Promethearchaeota archaeon]